MALLLETLPADHPTRGFYEQLFKEMTGAVLAAQQPDGLWHPSLLDPDSIQDYGTGALLLVFTHPDAAGKVAYRAGFAWAADGAISTSGQWLDFLKQPQ